MCVVRTVRGVKGGVECEIRIKWEVVESEVESGVEFDRR
jgi:hypothetical protein